MAAVRAAGAGCGDACGRRLHADRVPGGEGIQLEFEGVAENGVEFVFITSVFGTDEGALQVTTFTSTSAAERHRATMLRFHDGIRLLKGNE